MLFIINLSLLSGSQLSSSGGWMRTRGAPSQLPLQDNWRFTHAFCPSPRRWCHAFLWCLGLSLHPPLFPGPENTTAPMTSFLSLSPFLHTSQISNCISSCLFIDFLVYFSMDIWVPTMGQALGLKWWADRHASAFMELRVQQGKQALRTERY